jgi:2-alkyl-3-oxoalkanoate reductase
VKVLIAGATGAIGRPLVSAMTASDHEPVGLTSSKHGLDVLRELGAEGVVANALDAEAVHTAVARLRPDAVIEELTSLPKHGRIGWRAVGPDTPEEVRAAPERDRRVRLEGGGNVYHAAKAAGTTRYVTQSTGFFYGPGEGLALETDALASDATPGISSSVRTYLQVEHRVLQAGEMDGVALRYGYFYGPGTWFTKEGDVADQVRERKCPLVGSGEGAWSWVHVDDAAAATIGALEGAPGIYNVVDDEPSRMSTWLPAFAATIGAPEPPRLTEEEALQRLGPDFVYYASRLRGASNAKARRELGLVTRARPPAFE